MSLYIFAIFFQCAKTPILVVSAFYPLKSFHQMMMWSASNLWLFCLGLKMMLRHRMIYVTWLPYLSIDSQTRKINGNMVSFYSILFLITINIQKLCPQQNKKLIRFITDCLWKFVGVFESIEGWLDPSFCGLEELDIFSWTCSQ